MWSWLIGVAQVTWNAIQVGVATAVAALWSAMVAVWNTFRLVGSYIVDFSKGVWKVFRVAWDDVISPLVRKVSTGIWSALRATWDNVIGPALWKFGQFVDWIRQTVWPWLHKALDFLIRVRNWVLKFYGDYIRPILDAIDATRQFLRLLEALHVKFAAKLDAELGRIEELIDKPFRLVLAKINEIIGIVNRVITLDGLLQRVALIRSLVRDYQYAWRAMVNPYSRSIQPGERERLWKDKPPDVRGAVVDGIGAYLEHGGGPYAEQINTVADAWASYL